MKQWKLGSLTLGVTLIFLGAIFLIGTFTDLTLVGNLIKLWPIILIFIGLEILLCNFSFNKENKRLKFTGSSVIIIILLLLICAGLFTTSMVIDFDKDGIRIKNIETLRYKYNETFDKTYSISGDKSDSINIDSKFGNIFIDKSSTNNVEITSKGTIYANDKKTIDSTIKSLLDITKGKTITIRGNKESRFNNSYKTNLAIYIKVPEKMYVNVTKDQGNVEVNNLTKGLKVFNTSGNIYAKNICGNLITETSYGVINLRDIKGNVTSSSKNGNIKIANLSGSLDGITDRGYINIDNVSGKVHATTDNGQIHFKNSKVLTKELYLNSKHGDIQVSVPRNQTGYFDLKTDKGKLSSDLNLPIEKDKNGYSRYYKGNLGNNTPSIKLYSNNGYINISSN